MTIQELIRRLKLLPGTALKVTLLSQSYQVALHNLGYIPGDCTEPAQGNGWELVVSWRIRPSDVMHGVRDLSRGPSQVFLIHYDKWYRYDKRKTRHALTQDDILHIGQSLADGRFPDTYFDVEDLIFTDTVERR